jgi:hypothetical protein
VAVEAACDGVGDGDSVAKLADGIHSAPDGCGTKTLPAVS